MINSRTRSSNLEVRLFGEPWVARHEGPIRLSPQQLALVAIVYGHAGRGVSRPRAAELLWGKAANGEIRHRLRQLLVELRSRVGCRIVATEGDQLKPLPEINSDLVAFRGGLTDGSLLDAALILRGGFALLSAGYVSDEYEDWRGATEAALGRGLTTRARARWAHASAECDLETAKDAAEALFALDPMDPHAVLRMIQVLGMHGQPEAAEHVYMEYQSALPAGEEPSDELLEALKRVRRLKDGRAAGLRAVDVGAPLVGRGESLAKARTMFSQVEAGRFVLVLITGESGIGKTRLLRELHREAVLRGLRCLEGQGVELESRIPLNPILDALKTVDLRSHLANIGQPWDAVIGAMLPLGAAGHSASAPPPIRDSALPRRLLDAFSLLFESLATEQPTLLVIDDLQWADATTVATLQFMQRRWSGGSFGIMAAARPDLVGPSDELAKYLSCCAGHLTTTRIELGELTVDSAVQLVQQVGQGKISRALADRMCNLAGGHPLYLTELARDYCAGRLRLPRLPVGEVAIPVSLMQILKSRLTDLSDAAMKLAGMLAVAARPMRLNDARLLVGFPLDVAADAVDELRRARLIEYERDEVRIVHELFRSAIYCQLSEPRRAINHRAVAEQLEADPAVDSSGELATHYLRAGEARMAARHAWVAAERAMGSGAAAEAAHFYQIVAESDFDPMRRATAGAAQAKALHLARDINRANPLLESAANSLDGLGRHGEALRLQIKRVEGLSDVGAAGLTDLLGNLGRIKREARDTGDWEAVALALDAELQLLHRLDDSAAISTLFGEMREVADRGSPEATLICSAGLALAVLFGDPAEGLAAARRALALTVDLPRYRLKALLRLMVVLQCRGMLELPASRAVVYEARDLARRSGDVMVHYSIENNLATASLDAGDLEAADVQMTLARALAESAEMDMNRCIQANNRAELALAKSDYDEAHAAYTEASSYLGRTTPPYMMDLVHAGIGLCSLETGDLGEAHRREQSLRASPPRWHCDPTTILAFRTRLLECRRDRRSAIALLEEAAGDLEGRLVLAWLKIRGLQVRLLLKEKSSRAYALALDCRRVADDLQLVHRAREFARLVEGAGRDVYRSTGAVARD